jgi:hypothetical protein
MERSNYKATRQDNKLKRQHLKTTKIQQYGHIVTEIASHQHTQHTNETVNMPFYSVKIRLVTFFCRENTH